ncbi:MAG TPA: hypothetical protein VF042_06645 [Gemmatimonadaceae bacterium]
MTRRLVRPLIAAILVACSGGEPASPGSGNPAMISAVGGAAIGSSASGFETADSISIKVTDESGNPVGGLDVSFSVVAGGGSVSPVTRNTDTNGVARTAWTMGSPGAQTLRAAAGALNVEITANAVACSEMSLEVGQVRPLDPENALCAVLNGKAQRYLVTIVNAANSPIASASYKGRGTGGGTSAQVSGTMMTSSAATSSLSTAAGEETSELLASARVHASILQKNMELLQQLGPQSHAVRSATRAALQVARPSVGDLIQMKLPDITVNGCTTFTPVTARVVYVGAKGIMLEDTSNPLKGQVDTVYTRLGKEFDDVMFPILSENFGNPLILDAQLNNDGAMYMLFSTKVNTMGNGLIAGYVSDADLFTTGQCPSSNVAEVFYARAPTTLGGTTGEPNATWDFTRSIGSTMIHEAKHLTSFAAKMAQPGFSGVKPAQDGWLEESSAEVAQELWNRAAYSYGPKSNVDYAATISREVRPSTYGTPMNMFNALAWLYNYMSDTESHSLVGSVAPGDVTFYGSGWAFLRWVIDAYATSEPEFLTAMTRDISHFGIANIENLTGKSFAQLLSEYSLALVLDDYPGFTPAEAKYSFPSWNLPSIFAGLNKDFPGSVPSATPLKVRSTGFGKFSVDVSGVRGGGFSVLELSGTQASKQLLEFKASNGAALSASMQVNIARVQ